MVDEGFSVYHPHDVLCGRGPRKHAGNQYYRDLVQSKKEIFKSSVRRGKREVARSIVDAIKERDPPGRFLEKRSSSGLWYEIRNERATDKTVQALKEHGIRQGDTFTPNEEELKEVTELRLASSNAAANDTGDTDRDSRASRPQEHSELDLDPRENKRKIASHLSSENTFSNEMQQSSQQLKSQTPVSKGEAIEKSIPAPKGLHKSNVFKFSESHVGKVKRSCDRGKNHATHWPSALAQGATNKQQDSHEEPSPHSSRTMKVSCSGSLEGPDSRPSYLPLSTSIATTPRARHVDLTQIRSLRVLLDAMNSNETTVLTEVDSSRLPIYKSQSTIIYCFTGMERAGGDMNIPVAEKIVILSGAHSLEGIMRLHNEFTLSRHLKSCSAVRKAFHHETTTQFHVLFLEWAPGVTLRDWLSFSLNEASEMHKKKISLALEIARSISELHGFGVVHNDITADNIIVKEMDGRYSIKIIDLGKGSLLRDPEGSHVSSSMGIVDMKRNDLFDLGLLLYEMFSGTEVSLLNSDPTHDASTTFCKRKAFTERKDRYPPLCELKCDTLPFRVPIPLCVSTLVSTLIEDGVVCDRYDCVKEVEEDLQQILDDPEFFCVSNLCEMRTKLIFSPDRLYGRGEQVRALMNVFDRLAASTASPEMILLLGVPGSGKSALVRHTRDLVRKRSVYFVSGKFDRVQQNQPFSAIAAAFTEYCEKVVEGGSNRVRETRTALQQMLGQYVHLLSDIIPGLCQLIGEKTEPPVSRGCIEARNCINVIFRLFVRAIASPSHPLILFIDDLQWADEASLSLLHEIVTDMEIKSFVFVGTYRVNEVNISHPLASQLAKIEKAGVKTTKIMVENMEEGDLTDFVSSTLRTSKLLVQQLTEIVYRRTSGNPFSVVQFLKHLVDVGMLYYCVDSMRWKWTKDIESECITANAVELIVGKIKELPLEIQNTLKVAASLGFNFDECVVRLLSNNGSKIQSHKDEGQSSTHQPEIYFESLSLSLDIAVSDGWLEKVCAGTRYQFVHDHVRDAAYSLLSEREREAWHLYIGSRIWKNASSSQMNDLLFLVVDQLNLGSDLINGDRAKVDVAMLNLRAGDKAMQAASFSTATKFLKVGMGLLDQEHWEKSYALTLKLHTFCAESEYCNGDLEQADQLVTEILTNAHTFHDKISAYYTLLLSFGAQNKLKDAITTGFTVLEYLGESFPSLMRDGGAEWNDTARSQVVKEMVKTKEKLDSFTDEELFMQKKMSDPNKSIAMKFLYPMVLYANLWNEELTPFIACRIIQLSLEYGMCDVSCFGFATYGLVLCHAFGDIKRGYQLAKMALLLLKRFQDNKCFSRVYSVVFGCINPWSENLILCLEPSLKGYHMGLRTGDIEFSMMNVSSYVQMAFHSGKHLKILEEESRKYCKQMVAHRQDLPWSLTVPYWQTTLNLMGCSEDAQRLAGEAMDFDIMLTDALKVHNAGALSSLYYLSMFLAYLYGNYDLAFDMAKKRRNLISNTPTFEMCNCLFIDGLVCLALCRKKGTGSEESNLRLVANEAISSLKKWSTHCNTNFQHKLELLEAELAFTLGEFSKAAILYESSIRTAQENGFLGDEALACERAGIFHISRAGRGSGEASKYYDDAYNTYLAWGARSKADHAHCRSLSLVLVGSSY